MKSNLLLFKNILVWSKIFEKKKYVILYILYNDQKKVETCKYMAKIKTYEINKIIPVIKKGRKHFFQSSK